MGCGSSSADLGEKVEYLEHTPFMLHMDRPQLEHFATFTKLRKYPRLHKVFNEGDPGDEFFIIGSGEVDLTASDDKKIDQFLCSKKNGDFFGEAAIMYESHKRTATVSCSDECTMLVVNRKSYQLYLSQLDESMRKTVQTMIGERMVNVLKKIEWLSDLSEWKLQLLGNLFRYKTIQENEVIFSEGDMGRSLFIISKGSVKVSANGEDGSEVRFANLSAGNYFGEIALIADMPRTATVTALERCLLLVLGHDDFRNFLLVSPDLKEKFEKVVKDRTAEHFQKFKVPFFASIPRERFGELAALCVMQTYTPSSVIFTEGDPGNAFYLMVYGEVEVRKEDHVVGKLGPGKYFGEIALVTDSPRTATVIAKTRAVLLSITKDNFQTFFASNPEAYADFAIKISRYEVPLRSVLVHRYGRSLFREHLASEYSTENLEFWEEAGEFENIRDLSAEELKLRARKLIEKYIDSNSEKQVNIPSRCRDVVLEKFEAGEISTQLFVDARYEILKLMSSDSYKRFREGEFFKKLLEMVGTYEDGPVDEEHVEVDVEDKEGEDDDDEDDGDDNNREEKRSSDSS